MSAIKRLLADCDYDYEKAGEVLKQGSFPDYLSDRHAPTLEGCREDILNVYRAVSRATVSGDGLGVTLGELELQTDVGSVKIAECIVSLEAKRLIFANGWRDGYKIYLESF